MHVVYLVWGPVNLVNSTEGKDTVRKEKEYKPVSVPSEFCCKTHGLNSVSASNCSPKSQEIGTFIHHFCSLMVKNTHCRITRPYSGCDCTGQWSSWSVAEGPEREWCMLFDVFEVVPWSRDCIHLWATAVAKIRGSYICGIGTRGICPGNFRVIWYSWGMQCVCVCVCVQGWGKEGCRGLSGRK